MKTKVVVLLVLMMSGCGRELTVSPVSKQDAPVVVPTTPTATVPVPTNTPTRTSTPAITFTPIPTATPTMSPTPSFPVVYKADAGVMTYDSTSPTYVVSYTIPGSPNGSATFGFAHGYSWSVTIAGSAGTLFSISLTKLGGSLADPVNGDVWMSDPVTVRSKGIPTSQSYCQLTGAY